MPSVHNDSTSMTPCACRPASQSRAQRLEVPKHTTHGLNQLPSRYGSPLGFQRKLTRADLLIAIPAEVSRCADLLAAVPLVWVRVHVSAMTAGNGARMRPRGAQHAASLLQAAAVACGLKTAQVQQACHVKLATPCVAAKALGRLSISDAAASGRRLQPAQTLAVPGQWPSSGCCCAGCRW